MTASSEPSTASLSNLYSPVAVEGLDARSFLQSQMSCDMRDVSAENSLVGALLNPKGRVSALVIICQIDSGFLLLAHPSLVEGVIKRLTMMKFRANVEIAAAQMPVSGHIGLDKPGVIDPALDRLDTRTEGDVITICWSGNREIRVGEAADRDLSPRWQRLDIINGIPWIDAEAANDHVAQMLNLDRMKVINFKKGCFPGQEIVARAHYRGQVKRRLHLFMSAKPVAIGTTLITPDGARAGETIACATLVEGNGDHPVLAVSRDDYSLMELVAADDRKTRLRPVK